jgi:hypothetical protein
MNDIDDALSRLVAEADPLPPTDDLATVDRAWAAVQAELLDDAVVVPLRRPTKKLRLAGTIAAVAVVALAASAGSAFIATRTGVWNTPEWIPAGGPGEAYRLDGTDFGSELAQLAVDVPYPSEAARQTNLKAIVDQYGGARGQQVQMHTGALRAELARGAICAWTHTWQDADTDDQRLAATTALRGAMSWPAVTDVDPKPAIDGAKTDFGMGPTVFGHLPGVIAAAASGDKELLKTEVLESAFCAVTDSPPPDAGMPEPAPSGPAATPVATTRP